MKSIESEALDWDDFINKISVFYDFGHMFRSNKWPLKVKGLLWERPDHALRIGVQYHSSIGGSSPSNSYFDFYCPKCDDLVLKVRWWDLTQHRYRFRTKLRNYTWAHDKICCGFRFFNRIRIIRV